jgi:hypothetical protein
MLPNPNYLAVIRATIAVATTLTLVAAAAPARAVNDVLLQVLDDQIAVGVIDDETFTGSLGARVFGGAFLSNYRSANPGFVSLPHGHPAMPAGATSFPSLHNVNFDLLPMNTGSVVANLLYWDGVDLAGDGLTLADVAFAPPTGLEWEVLDANLASTRATGTDSLVPGGLIQRTSSDLDPLDGVDSGAIHKHLPLLLNVAEGNPNPTPPAGVYMIAWHARSSVSETSDPFLFVHRTFTVAPGVLDVAVAWAETNYDALFSPGIAGDFDGNGQVDGADFLAWQRTLGQPAVPVGSGADGDHNGVVDGPDLDVWRTAFAPLLSGATAVPEAGSIVLVVIGGLGVMAARRNAG